MRILGIACSGRRGGNTEILVKAALAAAKAAGAVTEFMSVAGKDIRPCDGCGSCRKTGKCRIQDDMQPVYQGLEQADAIIFGSPVYFGSVSAQAKAIIDRTTVFAPMRKLKGKVAAALVATRRVGGAQTWSWLCSYFVSMGMIPVHGAIGYGVEKGDVRHGVGGSDLPALIEAEMAGKEVVQMLRLFYDKNFKLG